MGGRWGETVAGWALMDGTGAGLALALKDVGTNSLAEGAGLNSLAVGAGLNSLAVGLGLNSLAVGLGVNDGTNSLAVGRIMPM